MMNQSASATPLVVDLDGTLIRTDLLLESALGLIHVQPTLVLAPLMWIGRGKAHLKTKLAELVDLDVATLPYNAHVLDLIQEARAAGREIVLATASHRRYADAVAAHLGVFDRVYATENGVNLSSTRKRDRLVSEFGEGGFDYAGNSHDDLPVWASARQAYVVEPDRGVESKARASSQVAQTFTANVSRLHTWLRALRMHQWVKNLLIFVPLLASHKLGQLPLLLSGVLAFLCFGLCASSVYILNDLLDLADDRRHRSKKHRAFAAGHLSIKAGLITFPLLLAVSITTALYFLPWRFSAVLGCYYLITLSYSLSLKRKMMIDVVTLAVLYTVRLVAGTVAFKVHVTFWMLAFSMFIFLSLALVKRYAELKAARSKGETEKTRGRGYYPDDLEMIAALGAASGYLSVMVLALYLQDSATVSLYRHPQLIWLACPLLLFWISRTWLLTHRGQMNDDPVAFAIKDKVSLVIGALFGLTFWLAS